MNYVREGDTIYIKDFNRLSRSIFDTFRIMEELENIKVSLVSISEKFDTSSTIGKGFVGLLAMFNQLERENIRQRQREGIEIAKKKGVYKGRKAIKKPSNWGEVYKQYQTRETTSNETMKN